MSVVVPWERNLLTDLLGCSLAFVNLVSSFVHTALSRKSEDCSTYPYYSQINFRYSGGYLTGKHLDPSKGETVEPGSHFDPKTQFGHFFISRYNPTAQAVRELQILVQQHNLELSEVAIRWIMHHSQMRPDDHGVIIGASRVEQVEKGLQDW